VAISKALKKTISWRIVASLTTFVIVSATFSMLPDEGYTSLAAVISAIELPTKTLAYYFHEKIWEKI